MLFSVIVPVFNAGAFLEDCVNSIRSQGFGDWELILVDDGSEDNSFELCRDLASADERIHALKQENAGAFFARKAGIEAASGDYVLFLDSDDEFERDALGVLAGIVDENHPDIIAFSANAIEEESDRVKRLACYFDERRRMTPYEFREELLGSQRFNSICFKAIKRELFSGDVTDYSSFRGKKWGEDKAMLLYPATNAEEIIFTPEPLYRYKRHNESAIRSGAGMRPADMLEIYMFELLEAFAERWSMNDAGHRDAIDVYKLKKLVMSFEKAMRTCASAEDKKTFFLACREDLLKGKRIKPNIARRLKPKELMRLSIILLRLKLEV